MPWSQAGKRSKQLDLETAGQREARLKRTGLNRARQLASETEEQWEAWLEGLRLNQKNARLLRQLNNQACTAGTKPGKVPC